ncbi:response regulator [Desulfonema ishimotonii]|uniref:response regulator n=1 Tax=Desulfonema ishimotonii TaxID=45657 RepID=UPI001407509C|nr:response regulator [Desulfonema ishimotonii]
MIRRILLKGHDVNFINALRRHLKRERFVLEEAGGPTDARDKIRTAYLLGIPFDLIIIEAGGPSPEMYTLWGWIKKKHPDISIITISGFGPYDRQIESLRADQDIFCQKPITPEEMIALIRMIDLNRRGKVI